MRITRRFMLLYASRSSYKFYLHQELGKIPCVARKVCSEKLLSLINNDFPQYTRTSTYYLTHKLLICMWFRFLSTELINAQQGFFIWNFKYVCENSLDVNLSGKIIKHPFPIRTRWHTSAHMNISSLLTVTSVGVRINKIIFQIDILSYLNSRSTFERKRRILIDFFPTKTDFKEA